MTEERHNDTTTPTRASSRRRGQRIDTKQVKATQEIFLQIFAMTANVRDACAQASIDRSTVYRWKEHDPEFSFRFNQAELDVNDRIRGELLRRAVQGYEKPVVSMGKIVYVEEELPDGKKRLKPLMERVYSDNLLSLLAKARMPEYRDKPIVDLGSQTADRELQKLQDAIAEALRPYPEIQERVSNALAEKGL